MTIKKLYDWAKSQNIEDFEIMLADGYMSSGVRDLWSYNIDIDNETQTVIF